MNAVGIDVSKGKSTVTIRKPFELGQCLILPYFLLLKFILYHYLLRPLLFAGAIYLLKHLFSTVKR